ncbi:hypothetical protein N7520_011648 [Penicillium odoratum]|uniref:uncharacterized protein n=1 Tax=Penicillium odoratum TaxID=1167516 RepID=UPI002548AA9F|nr:uncharacterized protein N7520_011648 [Penicillium odoratum]KAJ5746466.1 hypothetical protein N7520_011648 [Penicillium odoratum]
MPKLSALLRWNSITLHYVYFIVTSAIGSVIIYTATRIPGFQYADAAFMSFSAMTGTGLTVIDLSLMDTVQQATLFVLFILGHAIPILSVLSFTRAWVLCSVLKEKQNNGMENKGIDIAALDILEIPTPEKQEHASEKVKALPEVKIAVLEAPTDISPVEPGPYRAGTCIVVTDLTQLEPVQSFVPIDEKDKVQNTKIRVSRILARFTAMAQRTKEHLSWEAPTDDMDPQGVECRALVFLSILILLYIISFLSFGILSLGLWLQIYSPELSLTDDISPFWTGAFLATSSFASNGMSLIDTSMIPFQREAFPLLICGALILAGNTLFPCLLRLFIWSTRKLLPNTPTWRTWRQALDFALVQSQNVCSFLYPTWHTWFLFGTVLVFNAIMWGAFELASIQDMEIRALPPKYRVLDGFFQSLAIRGGGFSIVEFDKLPQGLVMLYGESPQKSKNKNIANTLYSHYDGNIHLNPPKYISAFPVSAAIGSTLTHTRSTSLTERLTNTTYIDNSDLNPLPSTNPLPSRLARGRFLYQQLRSQFSHDMWWLSFAIILITIAESDHYKSHPVEFSTFNVIFEVISAYSSVGASIGYPGSNFAFCGQWTTFSKLLLVAVSLKGRLRGVSIVNAKIASSSIFGSCEMAKDSSFDGRLQKTDYIEMNRRSCV